ncbi:hypothetical protein P3342_004252 [Pyrenophora teres f. teres]|nr:hypothetical protein P3342_004252 [Pyrenophora teres f. teres]
MPARKANKLVKRPFTGQIHAAGRPNKQRKFTSRGTESQPIAIEDTQPSSPREAPAIASKADDFESQLRDSRPEDEVIALVEASEAATVASTTLKDEKDEGFNTRFADNFDGVDWKLLKRFIQPPRTQTHRKAGYTDTVIASLYSVIPIGSTGFAISAIATESSKARFTRRRRRQAQYKATSASGIK